MTSSQDLAYPEYAISTGTLSATFQGNPGSFPLAVVARNTSTYHAYHDLSMSSQSQLYNLLPLPSAYFRTDKLAEASRHANTFALVEIYTCSFTWDASGTRSDIFLRQTFMLLYVSRP